MAYTESVIKRVLGFDAGVEGFWEVYGCYEGCVVTYGDVCVRYKGCVCGYDVLRIVGEELEEAFDVYRKGMQKQGCMDAMQREMCVAGLEKILARIWEIECGMYVCYGRDSTCIDCSDCDDGVWRCFTAVPSWSVF